MGLEREREREREGAFALSFSEKAGGFGEEGEGRALLNIFGCKYRLIYNKVSRTMRVTGFNGILCSK